MNKRNIIVLIGGILFGFGLSYSGMTKQEIVLSFLQLEEQPWLEHLLLTY